MYANRTTERSRIERVKQEIVPLCHAGLDSHSLRFRVFEQIRRAIPYAAHCCLKADPATLLFTNSILDGIDPQTTAAFITNELLQDDFNKFSNLAKSRRPVNTLGAATYGDLTRSRRYREILEPAGLGHEMRAVFRAGGTVWGALTMHREKRSSDFTATEVAFMAAIAPHLATGIRTALLLGAVEVAPASDRPELLLLTDDFTVVSTTPDADLLLEELDNGLPGNRLPMPVYAVVAKLRALERDPEHAICTIPQMHLRSRAGRWLTLYATRLSRPEGHIAVIIELATANDIAPFVLQAYALTAREREVTALVLKGCSTEDISARLCISMLTVQQHLKAIFDKVGVRSRRELVAQIFAHSHWPTVARERGMAPEIWSLI